MKTIKKIRLFIPLLFAALSINAYAAENDLSSYKIDIKNDTTSGRTLKFDIKSKSTGAMLLELSLESGENYSSPDIKVQLPSVFLYNVYKSGTKEDLLGRWGWVELPKVYGHNPYKRTIKSFDRDPNLSLTIDSSYDETSKKGHLTIIIDDVNSDMSEEL